MLLLVLPECLTERSNFEHLFKFAFNSEIVRDKSKTERIYDPCRVTANFQFLRHMTLKGHMNLKT